MRIHLLYLIPIACFLASLSSVTYANMCRQYLSESRTSTPMDDSTEFLKDSQKEAKKTASGFAKNVESTEVIPAVERIIDLALDIKLLNKPEARHLRHDLAELKAERNFKEDHPTFKDILGQWTIFITELEGKIHDFKRLTPQEQKAWKSKMELPVYFATAHFIVFLETKNNKHFDFSKMTTLLKVARDEALTGDIKLYLYAFEKQVRRYFSTKEFRKCKA